jgi:hypothetical protein
MPKKGSAAVFTNLESWQIKATCGDQPTQHCSITSKMNKNSQIHFCENLRTLKRSHTSCSKNWNISKTCRMTNGCCMELQLTWENFTASVSFHTSYLVFYGTFTDVVSTLSVQYEWQVNKYEFEALVVVPVFNTL